MDWTERAHRVARNVAHDWQHLDPEDIEQQIRLWVLENKHRVDRWDAGEQAYYFRQAAVRWCSEQTRQYNLANAHYIYTPDDIKKHIYAWHHQDVYTVHPDCTDDHEHCIPYGMPYIPWIDIENARKKLNPRYQALIIRIHYHDQQPADKAERKAAVRALAALADQLNQSKLPIFKALDRRDRDKALARADTSSDDPWHTDTDPPGPSRTARPDPATPATE